MKLTPNKALNKSFLKINPHRIEFDNFKKELNILLNKINENEREDHNKNFVRDFLRETFYKNHFVNSKGTTDLAIHLGDKSESNVGVIIEAKRPSKTSEMVTYDNLNAKAMHEVILYYLRERIEEKNDDIKNIIITNTFEWFIFDAQVFEKLFYKNTKLLKDYQAWNNDQKVSSNTEHFYKEIAKKHLEYTAKKIEFTYFNLRDYKKAIENEKYEKNLIPLLKVFSPQHLLKETFTNDSNSLDKQFYQELLHIIGLVEIKDGSKKVIKRLDENDRHSGSLLENTIQMLETKDSLRNFKDVTNFGNDVNEQLFNIALELNILWINRILFLKLLEAQLVNYNKGNIKFKFLNSADIQEYDDLFELFHQVLALKKEERKNIKEIFKSIPYLNSSLFEISDLERKTFGVDSLKDRFKLPVYKQSVFKKNIKLVQKEIPTLEYLFNFLEAFDFSSEVGDDIAEEEKSIINASVLGLIFEKLNGYKEGSYFTPGFITMYMARETIRRAVLQKFEDAKGWKCENLRELRDKIEYNDKNARNEANEIINSLKICDPAVGSGHFLVSSLNEILAIKSELQILTYRNGNRIKDYKLTVESDELNIIDEDEILFKYHLNEKGNTIEGLQKLQEALFHEKETLIENCLFGVDINPNSVNICRLRLWIELLKNTYYTQESGYKELETLPNIDINIKQGNSLISRFNLDSDISKALPTVKWKIEDYKNLVNDYKKTNDKELKRSIQNLIADIKSKITDQLDSNHPLNTKLKRLRKQYHDRFDTIDAFEHDLTTKQKNELEKKKKKLEKDLEIAAKEIIEFQEGEIYKQAFEWRFEFPEVLDEKGNYLGFDVVIGNPPYIGFQDLGNKEYYNLNYNVATGKYDIYILFIELITRISNGISENCFILPHKYLVADFGTGTRNLLNELKFVNTIIHFGDEMVFEDATTYTCLTSFSNQNEIINYTQISPQEIQFNHKIELDSIKYNLLTEKSWILSNPLTLSVLNKVREKGVSIKKIFRGIYQGIISGDNDAFYLYECEIKNGNYLIGYSKLLKERIKLELDICMPLLTGKNMNKWVNSFNMTYLIYPYYFDNGKTLLHTEKDIQDLYPLFYIYICRIKVRLENRGSEKMNYKNWFALWNSRDIANMNTAKIITPDVCFGTKMSFDADGKYYHNDTSYSLVKLESIDIAYDYLLGVLNARLIWFFLSQTGNVLRGGYFRFKTKYLEPLSIPTTSDHITEKISNLVKQILNSKKENPLVDTSKLESEIDELVYKLYGLTEEEIKIVEEKIK